MCGCVLYCFVTLSKVRLILQHTTAFNFDGINGSRGVPTKVLPVRLDTGDIILFHNSHLASQATKMFETKGGKKEKFLLSKCFLFF